MTGAVFSALLAAAVIGWVSLNLKQREDTVIGAVWAMGMATGIIFISLTPGYTTDLMSYLFGNILMVTTTDLWLIGALDVFVLAVVALFHKQLLAVCFDSEFATLRGVHVERFYFLLLALTALTVVLLVSVVGIILVIALLTLPAAMANLFAGRLRNMRSRIEFNPTEMNEYAGQVPLRFRMHQGLGRRAFARRVRHLLATLMIR